MVEHGWVLYVIFAALVMVIAERLRGRSHLQILRDMDDEHHRVNHVIEKFPHGTDWPTFKREFEQQS